MPRSLTLLATLVAASCSCESGTRSSTDESSAATGQSPAPVAAFDPARFAVEPPALTDARIGEILGREGISDREPSLHIGSRAPALYADGWLEGAPVAAERGTITVVENWATWCKPCVDAMPHLSELAEHYADRGVAVVAINVEDTDVDEVRAWVAERADDMRYSVGYDRSGRTDAEWIEAAGLRGLPASFVIDREGRVAWVGHPTALADVLGALVDGRWDSEAARRRAARERLAVPYSERVVELLETDPTRGYELVAALLGTVLRDQPEYLAGLAYHIYAAPAVAERDLELAYTAGAMAASSDGWSDPDGLTTLSRIREAQGHHAAALALRQRAASLRPSPLRSSRRAAP